VPHTKPEFKQIILEALLVIVVGLGLSLAANAISSRGLVLSRDYFPGQTKAVPVAPKPAPVVKPAPVAPSPVSTNEPSEAELLTQRLRDKGLQELKRVQAEKLFHDPRARDQRIVFIDARDEDHYKDGHIPGAFALDPYYPDRQLETVLPVCVEAEQVVVYCTGGDCEDSDTDAILLRDAGVPNQRIFVYGGGFTEWSDFHLPLETGARNSGLTNQSNQSKPK
jgi:rhodanese-related sulfurtransferase